MEQELKKHQETSDRWQKLVNEWGKWSEETFKPTDFSNHLSDHLIEEVKECAENPYDILEHVDCLMMVLNKARHHGFTMEDLYQGAVKKFEINKSRIWTRSTNGIMRHKK